MQAFDMAIKEIFDKYSDEIKYILEKNKEKQIVIFGAGELGHKVYDALTEWKVFVKCFCDNNSYGKTDTRTGKKIISLNDLKGSMEDVFFLIAVFNDRGYMDVRQQLLDFGIKSGDFVSAKVVAERCPISYLEKNVEKYRKVYSLLEEPFSKEVYVSRIKKAYLDIGITQIVSNPGEEYFDKNIILTDEEVFVDCGGFDGDTAMKFINRTNEKFKKIIIFEPEESKERLIKERMKNYRFDFYKCGVWSKEGILKFNARGDIASYVSEDGDVEIKVKALDETVFEDAPTYIKMDIEGSEIEALKGCRNIIREYKPKLAVCIYHNPDDLFEIPIMIKEMREDYKLYIRQYADSIYETVCYAI